jgi:16S rRNA (guanine527-N7)-methyltransferase
LPDTARSPAPPWHRAAAETALVELERLLESDAPALRATLPPDFHRALRRYVELLLAANDRINLTRVVEPAEVARWHLLDALSALPLIDVRAPERVVDLGSGGGVPGIVLALARPGMRWTLVDAARRKSDALRAILEAIPLRGVAVLDRRAELVGRDPDWREVADLVTARACAPLPVLVEYALPLLRVGGALLAWKGPLTDRELRAGQRAATLLGGAPPDIGPTGVDALGDHRFVLVEKVAPTPDGYPRRPGDPSRRPLGAG